MPHPKIIKETPFVFEPLFLSDEEVRPLFIPIVKACFEIQDMSRLDVAEKQADINVAGEYWGDSDRSSYKFEPEATFIKPSTDIVLVGHGYAPRAGVNIVDVSLQVGTIHKTARIFGDRIWEKMLGIATISSPKPFEKIPLVYERAFGGWDRSDPNPDKHTFEPRNPVGTGFHARHKLQEGMRLPNLEDPKYLIKSYTDKPPPAGFGFISPNWEPRVQYAGTYDEAWQKERMPLLPLDFDRRFFNAASPGLVAPGYLRGDEPVMITNASPNGKLMFNLPGIPPPQIKVELRGNKEHLLQTNLDTVIINTDENKVFLLWRSYLVVRNGPHDVVAIEVTAEGMPKTTVEP